DHLDRYNNSFQNYINSKFRIIQNQGPKDCFVFFADDDIIASEIKKRQPRATCFAFSLNKSFNEGAFIKNNQLVIKINNKELLMLLEDLSLPGKHNACNAMAAGISAKVLDIRKEIIRESLSDFQGVEHRLEPVIKVHGIDFINDSKATNINSTWYALESVKKPIIWILGGVDKGNDYSTLFDLVKNKVKTIVCLGKDNKKIVQSFTGIVETVVETSSMREAVKTAYFLADKEDTILLSPACASFDLFDNYEDRGRQFKEAVRNL
ncbi:UDP-N-acetylmuramoyl-L-alanine--D-glutamate ligase, partial [Bacteroidota bacterium]